MLEATGQPEIRHSNMRQQTLEDAIRSGEMLA